MSFPRAEDQLQCAGYISAPDSGVWLPMLELLGKSMVSAAPVRSPGFADHLIRVLWGMGGGESSNKYNKTGLFYDLLLCFWHSQNWRELVPLLPLFYHFLCVDFFLKKLANLERL